jgi:predicted CXXCH cytochrome family protein
MLWPAGEAVAVSNVAATVHNLSPAGKGQQKDGRVAGTCSYCHTSHNPAPAQALWSRQSSGVTYQLYSSTSMKATVDQPTGSSRLCLSCHDGVLALSSTRLVGPDSANKTNARPLTGPTVLGTDLRGSHPISFTYDFALAAKRGELADPKSLPAIHVDNNAQMQCTSCHDPHEDKRPKFMRMDNDQGTLCTTCHRLSLWNASSHATSPVRWNGAGTNPWPRGGSASVGANGCNNCHQSHAAGHGERLLVRAAEPENCTVCHTGTVAKKNVGAEFGGGAKMSRHPIEAAQWSHAPKEVPGTMPRHVTCVDCHNPHQAAAATGSDGGLPGPLRGVMGVNLSGAIVPQASHEYEVCFRCHGESSTTGITRVDRSRNIRDKVGAGSRSFHPIVAAARNVSGKGLVKGYTGTSTIGCIDCHNNSDGNPRGPHASRFAPILESNYVTTDPAVESPSTYAICYKCHDRNALVGAPTATAVASGAASARTPIMVRRVATSGASGFPHWVHVVKNQTSCAVCHDAHGSRANAHLINFMTRDATGRGIVSANAAGRLDYVAVAPGQGTCYLRCHGAEHNPLGY